MNQNRLREKGWSEEEIQHLNQHYSPKKEATVITIFSLLMLLFALIAVPYAYAILSQIIPSALLYTVLLFVASGLGAVFGMLLIDVDRLLHHHHIALAIIIPLISVTSMFVSMKNLYFGVFSHNAYIASTIYAIGFVIPYLVMIRHRWNLKKQ